MPPPLSIQSYEPVTAQFQTFNELLQPVGKIWPSFVFINCFFPYNVDGLRYLEVNDLFYNECFFFLLLIFNIFFYVTL
jgi:hypothetical protein